MKKLWTVLIIISAIIFAFLIVSYVKEWWPWTIADELNESPTPSASAYPSSSTYPTQTPVGGYKTISDSKGAYALRVPNSWTVTKREGASGKQVSYIEVQSPDFSTRTETASNGTPKIYYDRGLLLMIHVVNGSYMQTHETYGGNPQAGVTETKSVTIAGKTGTYHVFIHPTTYGGQLLDVHLITGGRTYQLTLAYNPQNADGRAVFQNIIDSFQIDYSGRYDL